MPAVTSGLHAGGRDRSTFVTCLPAFVAVGRDSRELDAACARVRQQIAFYASTPAYRGVLDVHGWSALGERLTALSQQGEWEHMAAAIDDDMLTTFAAVGSAAEVAAEVKRRYVGIIDRLGFATQDGSPVPDDLVAALRGT